MLKLYLTIRLALFTIFFSFVIQLSAQTIDNTINLYGVNFPTEKIHFHFDKEVYLPGETIWFKAYLMGEYLPSYKSTNLYTSLYDENGKLIQQLRCPIFSGTASGQFQIPDTLKSSQLICRAFTTWMLNFDSAYLYTKAIRVMNSAPQSNAIIPIKTVSLQFFPEGGDIIEGTVNTIAFKSNYNNGLPYEINGVLKKQETGEVVKPIQSAHDGMGRFDVEILPGEKLYAEWIDNNGVQQQTNLPTAQKSGVALKMAQVNKRVVFNLVNKLPEDSLHVLIYMFQEMIYKGDITVSSNEPYTNSIPVDSLPSGVLQITVFDAAWQPVAERVAFINNNNFNLGATITNTATSLVKRGKNSIEIAVPDTLPSNLSLSITDADFDNDASTTNMITDLLLSGDVRGYIHNPAYYFSITTDPLVKAHLDLVMLTHGWRRYNWTDMRAGKMPEIKYTEENYISLYGQLGKSAMQQTDTADMVNLIIKSKDSTRNFYFAKPDAGGFFKLNGLLFYDSANVYYSFNKHKSLNPAININPSKNVWQQSALLPGFVNYLVKDTAGYKAVNPLAQTYQYYAADTSKKSFNKEKTLDRVVVKNGGWHNWKNDLALKMDEKYTTGLFRAGTNSEAYDVLHDEMAEAEMDIYNYIGYKSHLIGVDSRYGGKKLKIGPGPAVGSAPSTPPLIFINESMVDASALENLQIKDVAYVKIIPTYFGTRNENGNLVSAVSIYLKKGEDLIDNRPKDTDMKLVKIPGFSPVKEFYAPDYSLNNTGTGTDARTTLLWMPYIITNTANQKVPVTFYNSDFAKRLKIVLEGFNSDGKMVHIEKIIE